MTEGVEQVSYTVQISKELLAAADSLKSEIRHMSFGFRPLDTPEKRRAYEIEQAKAREAARVAFKVIEQRHADLLAKLDPIAAQLVDHHKPIATGSAWHPAQCDGCDAEGYEVDSTEWPCSTWKLAEELA